MGDAFISRRGNTQKVKGNALPSDVLAEKTFSSEAAGIEAVGTMPDRGAVIITPGTSNKAIPAGFHNGQGYVKGYGSIVAGCERLVYNIGHQYTSMVQGIAYGEQATATLTLNFNSDHIYMYVETGKSDIAVVTNSKIDLTHFKKLIIDWEGEAGAAPAAMYARVVISSSKTGGYSTGTLLGERSGNFSRRLDRYNIEDITGQYYIRVHRCYDVRNSSNNYWSSTRIYTISLGL